MSQICGTFETGKHDKSKYLNMNAIWARIIYVFRLCTLYKIYHVLTFSAEIFYLGRSKSLLKTKIILKLINQPTGLVIHQFRCKLATLTFNIQWRLMSKIRFYGYSSQHESLRFWCQMMIKWWFSEQTIKLACRK